MLYLHFDKKKNTQMFIESTSIDLFDQMWVWHVPKLDSDVHAYHCY